MRSGGLCLGVSQGVIVADVYLYKTYVQRCAMESVNISELRANLLSYLKKASDGSEIAVTSRAIA